MIDTEILEEYSTEARELLDEMDMNLMRLEKEGGKSEILNNIFRAAHCIKGSAEYIGLQRSGTLTHGIESLLDRLREGATELVPEIVDFLFRAKDCVAALIDEVSKDTEEKSDITGLMEELKRHLGQVEDSSEIQALQEIPEEPEPVEQRTGEVTEGADLTGEITAGLEPPLFTQEELEEEIAEQLLTEPEPDLSLVEETTEEPTFEIETGPLSEEATFEIETGPLPEETPFETVQDQEETTQPEPTATTEREEPTAPTAELDAGTTIEATVPHLLNLSLHIDDLQDGLPLEEILPAFSDTIGRLARSMEYLDLPEGVDIFVSLEDRLNALDLSEQEVSREEVEGLRSFLYELRPYYPTDIFPWLEAKIEEEIAAPTLFPQADAEAIPESEEKPIEPETTALPALRSAEASFLADVSDDLLNEFDDPFARAEAPGLAESPPAISNMGALIGDLDSIGEDADREIMEIFLSYGWEIVAKIDPLVKTIGQGTAGKDELAACAHFVQSVRSSSTYMDFQNLAHFLDDWYERSVWASERIDALSPGDLDFMSESFTQFKHFLEKLEAALALPSAAPSRPTAPPAPPEPASVGAPFEPKRPPKVAAADARPHVAAPITQEKPTAVPPVDRDLAATGPADAPRAGAFAEPLSTDSATIRDLTRESPLVRTMRVDSAKVDLLLNQVGELVVNRSYVEQLSAELKDVQRELIGAAQMGTKETQSIKDMTLKLGEASLSLGRVATDIQEGVMKLRMLPVGQLFNRMPRLVRDLSRRMGKTVSLEVHGGDTEVDKRVIEQVYNPLVHLIRNAVDHGIEHESIRRKFGKQEEGKITLNAYSQGNLVVIDVEDDGGGIDSEAVMNKAVQARLLTSGSAKSLPRQEIFDLLFVPGFSTSREVTRTSGRGVGMDVVKRDVEKINGTVEIQSVMGGGTRISLRIPLTLAIIQALLVTYGKHVFAIPLTTVREIVQVLTREISTIEGFEVIKFREQTIPVLRLNEVFNLENVDESPDEGFLILCSVGLKTLGVLVEGLAGEQDVVIKPLAEHVFKSRGLAGSTILGDGTIAFVVDVGEIVDDIIADQRRRFPPDLDYRAIRTSSQLNDNVEA